MAGGGLRVLGGTPSVGTKGGGEEEPAWPIVVVPLPLWIAGGVQAGGRRQGGVVGGREVPQTAGLACLARGFRGGECTNPQYV